MIIHIARHTVRVSGLLIGALLILLAIFTLSARLALPVLANYKSGLESRVSEYLKSPVEIGELSIKWEGFGPLLMATDVSVFESDDRKVTLDQLLIDVNLMNSLAQGVPVFNELSFVGANFAVEAGKDGQFNLHGMESVGSRPVRPSSAPPPTTKGFDLIAWLFNTRKVGLLDSTVTLIDNRSDSTLVVQDLTIRAENKGDIHQLRVDMTLPEELGGKLEAGIDLTGVASNLKASIGNIYLRGQQLQLQALLDLASLGNLMRAQPSELPPLDTGVSLELWGKWRDGQLVSLRGPLSTSTVANTRTNEILFDEFSSSIELSQSGGTSHLQVSDISARLGDQTARIDQLATSWSDIDDKPWSISGSGVDLPVNLGLQIPLAVLGSTHPVLADTLVKAAPSGHLSTWSVDFRQGSDAPMLDLSLQAESLSMQQSDGLPGFDSVDAVVQLVNSKGTVAINAEQMPLVWDTLNDHGNVVDKVGSTLALDLSDPGRMSADVNLQILDDGIELNTRFDTSLRPGESPHIDLRGRYSASDVTAFKQWLPRALLPSSTLQWIDNAIQAGSATDGSLLFFGRLSDFPFDKGEGVSKSSVNISNGKMSFLPNWPAANAINGTLELDGLTLTGLVESSRLKTFNISQAQLGIADLTAPIVELQGTGSGDLQEMINFAKDGPLSEFLKPAMNDISGNGSAQMDINVVAPLYRKPDAVGASSTSAGSRLLDWKPLSVDGAVFLDDNRVYFKQADMTFEEVTGAVGFNLQGIRVNDLRARMLGQRVLVDANTTGLGRDATTDVVLQGALKASDVLVHYENTLDQFLQGASNWDVRLSIPHSASRLSEEGVVLRAASDLVGTELLLPAPFYKSTARAVPFELSTSFRDPGVAQHWNVSFGSALRAHASVSSNTLQSMLIALNSGEIDSASIENLPPGIRIQGEVASLAADGWALALTRYINSLPSGEPQAIMPISASLDVGSLIVGSEAMGPARLQTNTDDTYLNVVFNNRAVSGNLRYPRRHWSKDKALKARINHVDWSFIEALSSESAETDNAVDVGELDPRLLPPIEARVSRMTHKNVEVRDVVLRAQPDVSGLNINTLGFAYNTMRLVGQGRWHLQDPQAVNPQLSGKHTTNLNLVLQSDDFGVGLDSIGLKDILLDGQGSIEAQLSWNGPAYKPSIAALNGSAKMSMESGSIIPFEPGAGRVVGLFALQALPRRLNLDFKDITADGLAFKRITGDVTVEQGIANVELVQLTGPIGVVDISGQSDLQTREFDQKVTVLPRVSAALPIIGAISGGASAGIGALVAAGFLKVLGLDFDRIGLRNYSLTGTWDKPVFKPLSATNVQPQ